MHRYFAFHQSSFYRTRLFDIFEDWGVQKHLQQVQYFKLHHLSPQKKFVHFLNQVRETSLDEDPKQIRYYGHGHARRSEIGKEANEQCFRLPPSLKEKRTGFPSMTYFNFDLTIVHTQYSFYISGINSKKSVQSYLIIGVNLEKITRLGNIL